MVTSVIGEGMAAWGGVADRAWQGKASGRIPSRPRYHEALPEFAAFPTDTVAHPASANILVNQIAALPRCSCRALNL